MSSRFETRSVTLIMGITAGLFVLFIVLYPEQSFQASLKGLSIWWNLVFPALFPFLVISEILIARGAVHGLGVLIDHFTRLFYRVRGVGGWAIAMGLVAGYPAGAKITSDLRSKELIGRDEAERLLVVSHLCNPVFMITVVAAGFLDRPGLAVIIALVHYISALITGLLMRFHGADEEIKPVTDSIHHRPLSLPKRCLHAVQQGHREDGRGFGQLLGDAVNHSIQTLLIIGGYIMIFSVAVNVLSLSQASWALEQLFQSAASIIGDVMTLSDAIIPGLLEVTLGTWHLGQSQTLRPVAAAAAAGAMLGWSGLCMLLQIKSLIRSTDLRFSPFVFARLLHGWMAAILTFVLWIPFHRLSGAIRTGLSQYPVFSPQLTAAEPVRRLNHIWAYFPYTLIYMLAFLCLMILLSIISRGLKP